MQRLKENTFCKFYKVLFCVLFNLCALYLIFPSIILLLTHFAIFLHIYALHTFELSFHVMSVITTYL